MEDQLEKRVTDLTGLGEYRTQAERARETERTERSHDYITDLEAVQQWQMEAQVDDTSASKRVTNATNRLTHTVAVGAHIIDQQSMLLLYRTTTPIAWAPPGGRLNKHEHPLLGLHREISEECGLQVEIVCPTTIWYGKHKGVPTIGIFLLCRIIAGDLTLSSEHTAANWFTIEDIRKQHELDHKSIAFGTVADYERAFLVAKNNLQFR